MKYLPNKAQTRGLSQHNQVIIFKKNNKNARGINDQASCAVFFFIQRHHQNTVKLRTKFRLSHSESFMFT